MAKVVKTGAQDRKPTGPDVTITRRTTPLRGSDQRTSGYDRRRPDTPSGGGRK